MRRPAAAPGFPVNPRPGVRTGPIGVAQNVATQKRKKIPGLRVRDVEWTPILVGFLMYMFAIITYRLPTGTLGMVIGLLGIPLLRKPIRFTPLLAWFGAFVIWALISATLSPYPYAIEDAVTNLTKVWIVVFVGLNALRTRRQIQFFMVFVVGLYGAFPARGAIFNYFYGYTILGRAVWNYIYSNPNDLAALTLLQVGLAAALAVTERNRLFRLGAIAAVAVLPIVVLMTQSRGALLGLAIFLVLTLIGRGRKLRRIAYVAALAAIVIAVAPDGVWERASGIVNTRSTEELADADEEGSALARFNILKIAITIVRAHPVTGVGFGAYPEAHADYSANATVPVEAKGHRDTHNTLVNVAAETGIPGVSLLVGLLVAVLIRAERVRRRIRHEAPKDAAALWYLEAGFLAYMGAGLFGSFAKLSHFYLYLMVIYAFTLIPRNGRAPRPATAAGPTGATAELRPGSAL